MPLGRAIGVGIFPYYHTIIVVLLAVLCLAIINCCQNISLVPQTLPQACLSHKNNLGHTKSNLSFWSPARMENLEPQFMRTIINITGA